MPGRTPYRPSRRSRRINHAVARLAALGLTPANTVALEVVGRRSGRRRATAVVTTTHDQARYVVSLAGESDWVRNVRAAAGRASIRHRQTEAVRLVEVPPDQRAPVLAAYLRKRALTKSPARSAREYFGLPPFPSVERLAPLADRYPVFRVDPAGPAAVGSPDR